MYFIDHDGGGDVVKRKYFAKLCRVFAWLIRCVEGGGWRGEEIGMGLRGQPMYHVA